MKTEISEKPELGIDVFTFWKSEKMFIPGRFRGEGEETSFSRNTRYPLQNRSFRKGWMVLLNKGQKFQISESPPSPNDKWNSHKYLIQLWWVQGMTQLE